LKKCPNPDSENIPTFTGTWHAACNVLRTEVISRKKKTKTQKRKRKKAMSQVLKLQTLKFRTPSNDVAQLLMSTASGICPTGNADSRFEME
jgi:hypothetical protein